MADTLWEDTEYITKRFACDCGHQGHCLDICLELCKGEVTLCSFSLYMVGRSDHFVLRLEDAPELLNLVARILNNPNTSGT